MNSITSPTLPINIQPMIYSYSRVSTFKQLKGTGKQQQAESLKLDQLSKKYGLPISNDIFDDSGKSAFHGEHLEGSLGVFIREIEAGKVAKGSILAVFSLDRLSRLDPLEANHMFSGLLLKGIKIYTGIDDKLYGDPQNQFVDMLLSMVHFQRANSESVHKSERTIGHALTMINKHIDGVRSPNGYAYAIKSLGGMHPWWIKVDPDTNEVKQHPIYFDIAKDVLIKRMNGWGVNRLLDYLNDLDVEPPVARNHKMKGSGWGNNMISRMHYNTSPMGTRTLTVRKIEYKLENYFPPLISEIDLYNLQERLKGGEAKASKERISLLTGMQITKCKLCGNTVGSKFNRYGVVIYSCLGREKRIADENGIVCKGWTVTGFELDVEVMLRCKIAIMQSSEVIIKDDRVESLEMKLNNINKEIENYNKAIGQADDISELMLILNKKVAEREKVKDKLLLAQQVIQKDTSDLDVKWEELTRNVLDPYAYDSRAKMRSLIKEVVEEIQIKPLGGKGKSRRLIAFVRFRDSEHVAHIHFKPYFTKDYNSFVDRTQRKVDGTMVMTS